MMIVRFSVLLAKTTVVHDIFAGRMRCISCMGFYCQRHWRDDLSLRVLVGA